MDFLLKWLFAFAITLSVEYLVVQSVLGWRHRRKVAINAVATNLATHPLFCLILLFLPQDTATQAAAYLIGEAVVPAVEACVALYLLRGCGFSRKRMVFALVLANLVTAALVFVPGIRDVLGG